MTTRRDHETAESASTRLTFGTAGLRGRVRPGPGGMNLDLVRSATAALAQWLTRHGDGDGIVVVGRDARHGSREFYDAAVAVMRSRGFDVVALPGVVPTPVLAFTTRRLGAVAGVMITASHNPPSDNGYKVYLGGDSRTAGAQLVSPADVEIEALIDQMADASSEHGTRAPAGADHPDTRASGAVFAYLDRLRATFGGRDCGIRIALTPMHGVGGSIAVEALRAAGVTEIDVVDEQFDPDPDFPTVEFPNPEEPAAADRLLALASRRASDIAIALDPDADRCAVATEIGGRWRMLTGDETGALLTHEILSGATDGDRPLVASTLVSGSLAEKVCAEAGARFARTLTGFKWLVRAGDGLAYAYEEAIGHCVDPDYVRDKDGISAAVAIARMADRLRRDGGTLATALDELFVRHGVHRTGQLSVRTERAEQAAALMSRWRAEPPSSILGMSTRLTDHERATDGLRTNAVEVRADDPSVTIRVIVRPSGTEPKVKFYLEVARRPAGADRLADEVVRADDTMSALRAEVGRLNGRQV